MTCIVHTQDSPYADEPEKVIPRYRSHKIVGAVKIGMIDSFEPDGTVVILPEDPEAQYISHIITDPGWYPRYGGSHEDRGYWIQYEDGFTSWSPTDPFESGYARLGS